MRLSAAVGHAGVATRQAYLVEHYRPGSTSSELDDAATRVRNAVGQLERDGRAVHFRHSTVVATDELLLCVIEAASQDVIRLAYDQANVRVDRISSARTQPS